MKRSEHEQPFASVLRSRAPVFAAFLLVIGVLGTAVLTHHHLADAWTIFRVPVMRPALGFGDTRTITHSIDSVLSGRNPYVDRSFDPWHRLYNYPPIWLELRHLGVRSTTTKWIAALFAVSFFAACLALFRARNWIAAGVIFLALLSRPVLFALERGNSDLLIFAILVIGALWIGRRGGGLLGQGVLLTVLTVLKIYPVVMVIGMVRNRKAVWAALATALAALAALVLTCGPRLFLILRNTPWDYNLSFGCLPFCVAVEKLFGAVDRPHIQVRIVVAILLASVGVLLALRARRFTSNAFPVIDLLSARGFLAVAGMAVYVFAFLESSYDYRLIFMLCPLMYIVDQLNERVSAAPLAAALSMLFFFWSPHELKEILDGFVFVAICAWLTSTLLNALKSPSRATMGRRIVVESTVTS